MVMGIGTQDPSVVGILTKKIKLCMRAIALKCTIAPEAQNSSSESLTSLPMVPESNNHI